VYANGVSNCSVHVEQFRRWDVCRMVTRVMHGPGAVLDLNSLLVIYGSSNPLRSWVEASWWTARNTEAMFHDFIWFWGALRIPLTATSHLQWSHCDGRSLGHHQLPGHKLDVGGPSKQRQRVAAWGCHIEGDRTDHQDHGSDGCCLASNMWRIEDHRSIPSEWLLLIILWDPLCSSSLCSSSVCSFS